MLARVLLTRVAQCEHRHLRASLVPLIFAVAKRDLNASRKQFQILRKDLSSICPAAARHKPDDCARTSSSQSRGRV